MKKIKELLPYDAHNKRLAENVSPSDWENPSPAKRYNLVVIGGGTAGLVTAAGAAGLGAKVALIEEKLLGGDCLNVGCVPSKTIIRSSRVISEISNAHLFGIKVPGDVVADFPAVMERMRKIRAHISPNDSVEKLRKLGVDIFFGKGKFRNRNSIEVEGNILRFKKAVIATGARPFVPPIDGLEEAGYLTNETVFSLTTAPKHLVVVGGGPIGCELSQAFRRLGVKVTIIQKEKQFLTREDTEAAKILENVFRKEGINMIFSADLTKVVCNDEKKILTIKREEKEDEITADEILIGTGRIPNIEGLCLEKAGVEYEKSGIIVNDYLQTSNPIIYSAGDVCMQYKFTHAADAAARIVIQNALFRGRKKISSLTMPWCTYTDPEIAHTGMYERDAMRKGIEVDIFKTNLADVDRAITDGETEGFVKIIVKKNSDKILGATVVARHAGDMISEVTLAIENNIGLKKLTNIIHPYPTQAEAIKRTADAYNRSRLSPFIKGMFKRWFIATR
ncbi:MAG: mercuric reductase [Candidatus Schekmanbacteria bacterium]|nr:MAG: mercuric reductase [Candidatus Schekmanbacteria bacterium]